MVIAAMSFPVISPPMAMPPTSGNKWRVHFAPDAEGSLAYMTLFRTGNNVAISDNASAGQATAFDGANGTFEVGPLVP